MYWLALPWPIRRPDLADFGFSNGGNTAMQIAIRHPELVNKLVIASSFYQRDGFVPGFWDGMNGATIDNMPGPLKDAFRKIDPDSTNLLAMFNRDRVRMQAVRRLARQRAGFDQGTHALHCRRARRGHTRSHAEDGSARAACRGLGR